MGDLKLGSGTTTRGGYTGLDYEDPNARRRTSGQLLDRQAQTWNERNRILHGTGNYWRPGSYGQGAFNPWAGQGGGGGDDYDYGDAFDDGGSYNWNTEPGGTVTGPVNEPPVPAPIDQTVRYQRPSGYDLPAMLSAMSGPLRAPGYRGGASQPENYVRPGEFDYNGPPRTGNIPGGSTGGPIPYNKESSMRYTGNSDSPDPTVGPTGGGPGPTTTGPGAPGPSPGGGPGGDSNIPPTGQPSPGGGTIYGVPGAGNGPGPGLPPAGSGGDTGARDSPPTAGAGRGGIGGINTPPTRGSIGNVADTRNWVPGGETGEGGGGLMGFFENLMNSQGYSDEEMSDIFGQATASARAGQGTALAEAARRASIAGNDMGAQMAAAQVNSDYNRNISDMTRQSRIAFADERLRRQQMGAQGLSGLLGGISGENMGFQGMSRPYDFSQLGTFDFGRSDQTTRGGPLDTADAIGSALGSLLGGGGGGAGGNLSNLFRSIRDAIYPNQRYIKSGEQGYDDMTPSWWDPWFDYGGRDSFSDPGYTDWYDPFAGEPSDYSPWGPEPYDYVPSTGGWGPGGYGDPYESDPTEWAP